MSWSAKKFWNNHSWPSSESIGIAAESYQRNQAQRKILQRSSMRGTVWLFRDALTFSDVLIGIDFVRGKMWASQTVKLDFLQKVSWKSMTESGGLPEVPVWKHRVAFSRFTLDRHRGQYSAFQLLSSTLTFTDVLIGIDHFWTNHFFDFLQSHIENRTESGGTYQRNQAFRLTTACGFFEMPWPSQDVN